MQNKLLVVSNLKKYFPVGGGFIKKTTQQLKAVDDVSLYINSGETLGLVGESGCGKTTFGKAIINLIRPTSGQVEFDGQDILNLQGETERKMRTRMQIVFQDPYGSLNARISVGNMIAQPMLSHGICNKKEAQERTGQLLDKVGLRPFHAHRYPHEFSGGQRQRIAIARALSVNPEFIVCDEPVSALDVSVQSQVLNLLTSLKRDLRLTYLFISHDLSVVRHISDRIGVMYLGKLVELAPQQMLFDNKLHPYTEALFSAMPLPRVGVKRERTMLQGDLPSPISPPPGCSFHARCPRCMPVCREIVPTLLETENGHFVACHLQGDGKL